MTVRMHTPRNQGGENHVKGRKGGVEGTYGASRGEDTHKPVGRRAAEKTVYPGERDSEGGGEGSLSECASELYGNAVKNGGGREDGVGDKALRHR
jgi:hypothetical protein